MADIRHGQRAGYLAHLRLKQPACTDCKAAHAAYMRKLRRSKTGPKKAHVFTAALHILRQRHPDEFADIYDNLRAQREG